MSFDRHRTVVVTTLAGDPADAVQNAQPVLETIRELQTPAPGFEVLTLGAASIIDTVNTTAEAGIAKGESIGIIVALIVMAVVFGTLVAAGLPIVLTIVALLVTTSIAMTVSHVFDLNTAVIQMIGMIGLAVGIDYTLFIVARYREERERGLELIDAITRAGDTSSKAVLFSGLTVVVSLLGMLIVPWNLTTSMAGAIVVVIVSVLMTLTLLPAVLRLLGDRINRGKIPFIGYQRSMATSSSTTGSGFWGWTSRAVMRRPVVSLIGSAGLLRHPRFLRLLAESRLWKPARFCRRTRTRIRAYHHLPERVPRRGLSASDDRHRGRRCHTPRCRAQSTACSPASNAIPFFGAPSVVTAPGNDLVRIDVATGCRC